MKTLTILIFLFSIQFPVLAQLYGCTDPEASNFSIEANLDDGSCCYNLSLNLISPEEGTITIWSTDSEFDLAIGSFIGTTQLCVEGSCFTLYFLNYSSTPSTFTLVSSAGDNIDIIIDAYSSKYWVWNIGQGLTQDCSDQWACNYNPTSQCSSYYTCTYDCMGCTNPEATNFNPDASIDDGSCCFGSLGCMESDACNYDANAVCQLDYPCFYDCYGCTDETAPNYNPEATLDDGSCCTTENYAEFISSTTGYFQLSSSIVSISFMVDEPNVPYYMCIPDGCYNFSYYSYSVESIQTSFTLTRNGEILIEANQVDEITYQQLSINPIFGCTDIEACNYSPTISCSDLNMCTYDCYGCTDPAALNYNSEATIDNNSCCYVEYTIIAEQSAFVTGCWVTANLLESGFFPELNTFCLPNDCFKITYDANVNAPTEVTIVDQNGDIMFVGMTDQNGFIEIGFDPNGIVGCGNEGACNYNPDVTCNVANSCTYDCYGCMDPSAFNYDPQALLPGFCCYDSWLILEISAPCNYVVEYTDAEGVFYSQYNSYPNDNGFCVDPDYCFNITFLPNPDQEINYSIFDLNENLIANGTGDYGTVSTLSLSGDFVYGCSDVFACNFDPLVNCADMNACTYDCYGCTNPEAFNFDQSATIDNGTCCFDGWISLELSEPAYITVESVDFQNNLAFYYPETTGFCAMSQCNQLGIYTYTGNALYFSIHDQFGNIIEDGYIDGYTYYPIWLSGFGEVVGCLDPMACNFNAEATCDGACEYYCGGCTDNNAINFSSQALFDDGTCFFEIEAPNIIFQTQIDEAENVFYIEANFLSLGNGSSYVMSNSYNQTINLVNTTGNYSLGPFPCDEQVIVSLHSAEFGMMEYVISDPIQVNCTNSINQIPNKSELRIFPNPSNGQFTLTGMADGNYQIQVTDLTGRMVYTSRITSTNGRIEMDLSNIAVGQYQVTLINESEMQTTKFLIQH